MSKPAVMWNHQAETSGHCVHDLRLGRVGLRKVVGPLLRSSSEEGMLGSESPACTVGHSGTRCQVSALTKHHVSSSHWDNTLNPPRASRAGQELLLLTTTLAKAVFKKIFLIIIQLRLNSPSFGHWTVTTYKLIITVQVFGAESREEMLAVGYGEKD